MKWVTFIFLLFLFSSAYSRGVFRREAGKSEIIKRFREFGEQEFKGLVLVTFSQILQKTSYDDLAKFTTEVTDLAKACVADEFGVDCNKPLDTIFGEEACKIATLRDTYGDMADCCANQDLERFQCLIKYKEDTPTIPPLHPIDPDALCISFDESSQNVLGHFVYEVARRNPYLCGQKVMYFAEKYKGFLTECCKAADKGECLTQKTENLKKTIMLSSAKDRFKCSVLEKYEERGLKAWLISRLSRKFPQAEFTEITKIATDLTKIIKESCSGDLLESTHDRVTLANYICENQDKISKKVGECCVKPLLERYHCIIDLEEDDKLADLPALTADYAEDKDVCKNYAEAKDIFLGMFLYEYSRRHPEYGSLLLLRIAKAYEAKLEKCCAEADPPACYGKVFEEFEPLATEPQNVVKQNCDLYEQLGEYKFQNALLIRYTQKAPQVSTPTLVEASRNLGRVGTKCCKLPESHRMPCVEDYLTAILNTVCVMHEKNPVSERITKCCSESFVNKRACFSALSVDDTYVPKEFHADTFTFHADICTLPETEQQIKKQTALAELVKHKPTATIDQLKTVMGDFVAFLDKCCKADDKDTCFSQEGPKFVAASQAALA
uniref:albumin-like n=1 Tax=Ictidomys tridecemlineatus TaxID=43179 RepID=UPI00025DA330|nr:albumin-like [Ictidomys tridecemlineatus]